LKRFKICFAFVLVNMAVHSLGLHHFFTRKNLYSRVEKYPSTKSFKKFVDRLVYFVAIIVPFINIPQAVKIWYFHDVGGISLISWVGFLITSFFWLIYGIAYKQKPLIIMYTSLTIIQFLIVIGTVLYD